MASTQSTHPFTCNSCQVAFKSSDLQRTHMQSDWHRYNLKRRVASLPPLSSEIFAEKVLASKADAAATAAHASFKKTCEPCQKTYFSENAFSNHLGSAKHKVNAGNSHNDAQEDTKSIMSSTFSIAGAGNARPGESIDEDAEEEFEQVVNGIKKTDLNDSDSESDPVSRRPTRPHHSATGSGRPEHPLSPDKNLKAIEAEKAGVDPKIVASRECLFCNEYSPDLDSNIAHMTKAHGLFIPEQKYLVDLNGLILHLNKKVYYKMRCLACHKLKWSEDGLKQHMRDLGHCKIAYETEGEQLAIGRFYDFRSTYSDADEFSEDEDEDEEMSDAPALPKLGARRTVKLDSDEADEEGWESASTISDVPTEELDRLYEEPDREEMAKNLRRHRHHAHNTKSRHLSIDGWHSHAHSTPHAVYYDEFELHLPSGRVAGHRAHQKYFRQNLHSHPSPDERAQRLLTEGSSNSDDEGEQRGRDRGPRKSRALISRADGGLGMIGISDQKKRQVKAMEKKERREEARFNARRQWAVNKKGNMQKHYRDPLLQ
ncbi:pre-60S factor REI1 [Microthyrium microscopicum]|uniref:Pre-60S factor REI1 n=1 Tax=Microthyrium microscopicum TaxID=703497 RepID=A0A6A6UEA9_9PEZI|nr:pre-60S factor REI1 [Microthyrium microscopicum]